MEKDSKFKIKRENPKMHATLPPQSFGLASQSQPPCLPFLSLCPAGPPCRCHRPVLVSPSSLYAHEPCSPASPTSRSRPRSLTNGPRLSVPPPHSQLSLLGSSVGPTLQRVSVVSNARASPQPTTSHARARMPRKAVTPCPTRPTATSPTPFEPPCTPASSPLPHPMHLLT